MSERMPVLIAAMSVAMSARCDQLTAHAVEDMRVKAEELLAKGDAMRTAIIAFATAFEQDRHDRDLMAGHAAVLQLALDAALQAVDPEPVRAEPAPQPPVSRAPIARPTLADPQLHDWMARRDING